MTSTAPSPPPWQTWPTRHRKALLARLEAQRAGRPSTRTHDFTLADLRIRTKDRQVVPFAPNAVQAAYLDTLCPDWRTTPIRLEGHREILLKARQFGFSTLILALLFLDTVNTPNTQTVVIAHDADSTERLFQMVHRFYQHLPADRRPATKYSSRRELAFRDTDSYFYVGTAGSSGYGRGGTINNVHACIIGSMQVIGKDGFVYPVTDPPKQVRDGNGRLIDVVEVAISPHAGETILEIRTGGNGPFPIGATPDHRILCRGGKDGSAVWKRADAIRLGDYVAFPVTGLSTKTQRLKIPRIPNCKRVAGEIALDGAFGELCGWYLAEGSPNRNGRTLSGITFTVDEDEAESLTALLVQFQGCFSSLGVPATRPDSRAVTITAYGRPFAEFLVGFLGAGDEKRIPDSVWTYPSEFAWGLVRGLLEGDGSFAKPDRVSFSTTRPQLAVQLKRLALALRIGYPSLAVAAAGVRYGRNCQEQWTVRFFGPGNVKLRRKLGKPAPAPCASKRRWIENHPNHGYGRHDWRRGKDYYWAKVTGIEEKPAPDQMYDLVLAKDPHSFCTLSGVVHNSEIAFWPDAEEIVTGLFQAVPADGNVFLETTANGQANWYYDEYSAAVRGASAFVPRFHGWNEHHEYREESGEPLERTEEEQVLANRYSLDDAQLRWRRGKVKLLRDKFVQEFPINAHEAFISSGGRILSEFIPEPAPRGHLVPDFIPPKSWRHYLVIDPGWRTLAALFAAVDPEGRCWLYAEHYKGEWRPEQHLRALDAMWKAFGKPEFDDILMDPAGFDKRRTDTGHEHPSWAAEFALVSEKLGIDWFAPRPADNGDPLALRVKRYLATDMLRICSGMHWWQWEQARWVRMVERSGRYAQESAIPEAPIKRYRHLMDTSRYLANLLPDPEPLEPLAPTALERHWERMRESRGERAEEAW